MSSKSVDLRPANQDDIENIAIFFARHFPESTDVFRTILSTPWPRVVSNLGYVLVNQDEIVGVYAAIYSQRHIRGQSRIFCNMAAWAVDEPYRRHSLKLLQALAEQNVSAMYTISASSHAGKVLRRRSFDVLDSGISIFPAIGFESLVPLSGGSVSFQKDDVQALATPQELQYFADHEMYACTPFVVKKGDRHCVAITQRRTSPYGRYMCILYAGNWELLNAVMPKLGMPFFLKFGNPFIGVETRFLDRARPLSVEMLRTTYYKARDIAPREIDGLYTEYVPQYSLLEDLSLGKVIIKAFKRGPKVIRKYFTSMIQKS